MSSSKIFRINNNSKCQENAVISTKYDKVQENEHMKKNRLETYYHEEADPQSVWLNG